MSREAFEAVIGKAIVEAEFRCFLLADPERALADFELTEKEQTALKQIDAETLDSLSAALAAHLKEKPCREEGLP